MRPTKPPRKHRSAPPERHTRGEDLQRLNQMLGALGRIVGVTTSVAAVLLTLMLLVWLVLLA